MPECPTCEKSLNTELGLKQHHTKVHGESLIKEVCEWCDTEFKPKRSSNPNRFCSLDCFYEWESEYRSEHWQKKGHPQWKEETVRECEWCEQTFKTDSHALSLGRGRFCSQECHHSWREEKWIPVSGKEHPNWEGGSIDYGENWSRKRRKVNKRDEVCKECGEDGSNTFLDVHHIIPIRTFDEPEEANTMDNLVLLCWSCHMKVENGNSTAPTIEAQ